MLGGDETVSVPRLQKGQVSSDRITVKTMIQTQDTIAFRIETMSHGDQSAAIALCAPREQLTERQRDSPPHGIGGKCRWRSGPRPNGYRGNNFEFVVGRGSRMFGVGCGRGCGCGCGDCYTIVVLLLGITLLYPYVVGHPPRFCSYLNRVLSCYFSLTVSHLLCWLSSLHANISRRLFLSLRSLSVPLTMSSPQWTATGTHRTFVITFTVLCSSFQVHRQ